MTKWRKARVYLDTSVISYLDQEDAPNEMAITWRFWEMLKVKGFEVVVSNVVIKELGRCDEDKKDLLLACLSQQKYDFIHTNDEIRRVARKLIELGILKKGSFNDAQHLAVALYAKCDMIVSWNMRHIVCPKTIAGIRYIGPETGYQNILIATPRMVLEGDYDAEMPDLE